MKYNWDSFLCFASWIGDIFFNCIEVAVYHSIRGNNSVNIFKVTEFCVEQNLELLKKHIRLEQARFSYFNNKDYLFELFKF